MKKQLIAASVIALALAISTASPALAAKGSGKGGGGTTTSSYDGPIVYCDGNGDGTFTERTALRSTLESIRTPDDIHYGFSVFTSRYVSYYVPSQNLTTYYGPLAYQSGLGVLQNHCVIPG